MKDPSFKRCWDTTAWISPREIAGWQSNVRFTRTPLRQLAFITGTAFWYAMRVGFAAMLWLWSKPTRV